MRTPLCVCALVHLVFLRCPSNLALQFTQSSETAVSQRCVCHLLSYIFLLVCCCHTLCFISSGSSTFLFRYPSSFIKSTGRVKDTERLARCSLLAIKFLNGWLMLPPAAVLSIRAPALFTKLACISFLSHVKESHWGVPRCR